MNGDQIKAFNETFTQACVAFTEAMAVDPEGDGSRVHFAMGAALYLRHLGARLGLVQDERDGWVNGVEVGASGL